METWKLWIDFMFRVFFFFFRVIRPFGVVWHENQRHGRASFIVILLKEISSSINIFGKIILDYPTYYPFVCE